MEMKFTINGYEIYCKCLFVFLVNIIIITHEKKIKNKVFMFIRYEQRI